MPVSAWPKKLHMRHCWPVGDPQKGTAARVNNQLRCGAETGLCLLKNKREVSHSFK